MNVILRGTPAEIPPELLPILVGEPPPDGFPTNGAGPERLGSGRLGRWLGKLVLWLVPDVFRGWPIWIAAAWHDAGYARGKTWADRRARDFELGLNIILVAAWVARYVAHIERERALVCKEAPRKAPSFLAIVVTAACYNLGVRFGGWAGAFQYGPGEAPLTRLQKLREGLGLFLRKRDRRSPLMRGLLGEVPERKPVTLKELLAKLAKLNKLQAEVTKKYAALAIEAQAAAEAAAKKPIVHEPPAGVVPPAPPKPKPPRPLSTRKRVKVALVLARNLYGKGGTPSADDLAGCIADGNFRSRVYRHPINGWDTTYLANGMMTVAGMREWMGRVYDLLEDGDEWGIGIASHGSRITDLRDPTGVSAVICMDINDRPGPDGFRAGCMPSWDIAGWIQSLPQEAPGHIIGDLCYSGMDRPQLVGLEAARGLLSPPVRSRYLAPPPELAPVARPRASAVQPVELATMSTLYVTGCGPLQTCTDLGGSNPCGAHTSTEEKVLKRMPKASVRDVVFAIGTALDDAGYSQDPRPHGAPERLDRPWPFVVPA